MDAVAFDLLPATFGPSFVMTIMLSIVLRQRWSRSKSPSTIAGSPEDIVALLSQWPVLVRAVLVGAALTLMFAPAAVAFLWLCGAQTQPLATLLTIKMTYGLTLGLAVGPVIVLAVIHDAAGRSLT